MMYVVQICSVFAYLYVCKPFVSNDTSPYFESDFVNDNDGCLF